MKTKISGFCFRTIPTGRSCIVWKDTLQQIAAPHIEQPARGELVGLQAFRGNGGTAGEL